MWPCVKERKNPFSRDFLWIIDGTYCQLQIALELGYISDEDLEIIKPLFFETTRLIRGLRNSYIPKP